MRTNRRVATSAVAGSLAVGMLLASCSRQSASKNASAADFYKGKTITLVVPNAAGGDMDVSARIIAPYLQKAVGASAIKVVDVQGAGSVTGLNQLYSSSNNGLTIGYTTVSTIILTSLFDSGTAHYDAAKMVYIGEASTAPRVLTVSHKSNITTVAQLKSSQNVKVPIQGFDDDFYTQTALASTLGLHFKTVSGFDSLASEIVSVSNGASTVLESSLAEQSSAIRAGLVRPLIMISPNPVAGYESVPTWESLAAAADKPVATAFQTLIDLGRAFYAPPGFPTAARDALSSGLLTALKDKSLAARMEKAGLPIVPLSGTQMQTEVVSSIQNIRGSSVFPLLKTAKSRVGG